MNEPRVRTWLQVSLAVTALAVLSGLLAYVFLPRYLPGLLAEGLPANVHIEHLELRRPGWSSTRIARATLRVEGVQADTVIELENAALYYRLLDLTLHRVRVARLVVDLPHPGPGEDADADRVPFPEIRVPELDGITFEAEETALRWRDSASPFLHLADTRIGFAAGAMRVNSDVNLPGQPTLAVASNWTLRAGRPDTIEILAKPSGTAGATVQLQLSSISLAPALAGAAWRLEADLPEIASLAVEALVRPPFAAGTAARIVASGECELAPGGAFALNALTIENLELTSTAGMLLDPSLFAGLDSGLKPLADILRGIESFTAQTMGSASLRVLWPGNEAPEFVWQGDLALTAQGGTNSASVHTGRVSYRRSADGHLLRDVETSGRFSVSLAPPGTLSLGEPVHTAVDAPAIVLSGTAALKDGTLLLTPAQESRVRFAELRYRSGITTGKPGEWTIPRTDAMLAGALTAHFGVANGAAFSGGLQLRGETTGETRLLVGATPSFKLRGLTFDLDAQWRAPERWPRLRGKLKARGASIANGQLQAATISADIRRGKLVPLDIDAQTLAQGLIIDTGDWRLPIAQVQGTTRLSETDIRFDGDLKMRDSSPAQPLQVDYSVVTEVAGIDLPRLGLALTDIRPLLDATVGKQIPELKLSSGTLTGRLALELGQDKLQGRGSLRIGALMASLSDLIINDGTVDMDILSLEPLSLRQQIAVSSLRLGSDLDLADVAADLEVTGDVARLHRLDGRVLQGGIAVSEAAIEGSDFGPATLELAQVDMTNLFAWLGIKDLSGAGSLDAELPLRSTGGKLQIREGRFSSLSGGRIRYTGTGGTSLGNNLALRALDDFHYEKLDGTVDYNEDGEYSIKLHILGANPTVYDGFPIALNLDLSGRLPGVLQAALLTGDFSGSIIHQLRSGKLSPQKTD